MRTETPWLTSMIVLSIGILVGVVLVFIVRRRRDPSSAEKNNATRSSTLKGALIGGGTVAFIGIVGLALWQSVRPRDPGMGITGNDSATRQESTSSDAPKIVARETPRLTQARAALQANPESIALVIEYGYASAEAGGWVEVYNVAKYLLDRDPSSSDGRALMEMVGEAMGHARGGAKAQASTDASEPSAVESRIDGVVQIAAGVEAPANATLFIIARAPGVTSGPPLAAKRIMATTFPLAFSLSSADSMMGAALPKEVSLSARLDSDGDAMTKSSSDLQSDIVDSVALGKSDVQLVLKPN